MRRSTNFLTVSAVCVGSLFLLGSALPVNADWIDDFNGGLQATWQFGNLTGVGGSSGTFTAGSVNDQLQLTDGTPAAAGGAAAGFGVVLDPLGDLLMTGTVNPNGDPAISATVALLARADVISSQFYAAEIDYNSGQLILFRSDGPGAIVNLNNAPIAGLTPTTDIYVEFDLLGADLQARAYDAPNGTLLQSIVATDATYTAGLSGVLVSVADPNAPALGVWDDVSATTIPEPTTAALMMVALAGAMTLRARRTRK